jgi:sugar (pentulose or hexulose) kinase
LGLQADVLVSAGGGDNMMGAIGTGNTREGVITASFGTSGTIYACTEKPVIDPKGEIAAFCDSTNRWLPLLCTMNVTVATELMRLGFGWTHERFSNAIGRVPVGSGGLLLLPYLEGERTPNVPAGSGVLLGLTSQSYNTDNLARAAMEGVTLGMNYGLRRLVDLGVKPRQIRATGGGANSKSWRQIMADVFNAEVVTLKVGEGAAYGAALQALWCWRKQEGEKATIEDITKEFVQLNRAETAEPDKTNVEIYRELQALQDDFSRALREVFPRHRQLVLKLAAASSQT